MNENKLIKVASEAAKLTLLLGTMGLASCTVNQDIPVEPTKKVETPAKPDVPKVETTTRLDMKVIDLSKLTVYNKEGLNGEELIIKTPEGNCKVNIKPSEVSADVTNYTINANVVSKEQMIQLFKLAGGEETSNNEKIAFSYKPQYRNSNNNKPTSF
jgi:hypothetical protein